jgi:hypothetical protein
MFAYLIEVEADQQITIHFGISQGQVCPDDPSQPTAIFDEGQNDALTEFMVWRGKHGES